MDASGTALVPTQPEGDVHNGWSSEAAAWGVALRRIVSVLDIPAIET